MKPENIAYTARVSAAVWMIRKARKIASLLGDRMPDEQQAIEEEIVAIGRRMYEEACREPQPEVTHDPGGDYKLGLYANAVVELDASVDMWFIENDYRHGFTPEQTIRRWRDHVNYSAGRDYELEAYVSAVRELVPGADRAVVQYWYDRRVPIQETAQKWLAFLAFTEQQRKGVNP